MRRGLSCNARWAQSLAALQVLWKHVHCVVQRLELEVGEMGAGEQSLTAALACAHCGLSHGK